MNAISHPHHELITYWASIGGHPATRVYSIARNPVPHEERGWIYNQYPGWNYDRTYAVVAPTAQIEKYWKWWRNGELAWECLETSDTGVYEKLDDPRNVPVCFTGPESDWFNNWRFSRSDKRLFELLKQPVQIPGFVELGQGEPIQDGDVVFIVENNKLCLRETALPSGVGVSKKENARYFRRSDS